MTKTKESEFQQALLAQAQAKLDVERVRMSREKDEKRASKAFITDEEGKLTDRWARVLARAREMKKTQGQNAYIEWSTAIMDILASCEEFSLALRASGLGFLWTNTIGSITVGKTTVGEIVGQLASATKYKLGEVLGLIDKAKIPAVAYIVDVTEDGVINTSLLVGGKKPDAKEVLNDGKTAQEHFDILLLLWAKDRGYTNFDPATRKLTNADGKPMTPEIFKELNSDPNTRLDKTLTDAGLRLESSPSPRF